MKKNGTYHVLKSAIVDFKRNKIRTFLTSLGIVIGVFSVVLLIALGLGLKNYLQEQFESLGANLVMVMPGSGFGGGGGGFGGPAGLFGGAEFDEKDVSNLKRISSAKYVVPVYFTSALIESNEGELSGYVMGMNEDIFALMDMTPLAGKFFTKSDVASRAKKAVVGQVLAENLFEDPKSATGKTIRFKNQRFKVVGVLEKRGDQEMDNAAIIPYKTTFGNINPEKTFWAIYLGVEGEEDVEEVKQKAETILLKKYHEDDFEVVEQSEILSTLDQIFAVVNGILVAIGSISLLVGGVGIMNIMYATVTERTKEVGIRRAVGATEKEILAQFLAESVVLSLLGGLVGLALAAIVVVVTRQFFPAEINFASILLAIGISTAIGVFFGVFPARRAAKLPPIEAIRYE